MRALAVSSLFFYCFSFFFASQGLLDRSGFFSRRVVPRVFVCLFFFTPRSLKPTAWVVAKKKDVKKCRFCFVSFCLILQTDVDRPDRRHVSERPAAGDFGACRPFR